MQRIGLRTAAIVSLLMLAAACGGGGGGDSSAGDSTDGEGTPFEGIGDAASEDVDMPEAGSLTANADRGQGWVEVEGQRFEFEAADSSIDECLITEENLSVIYKIDGGGESGGTEMRLSGLKFPEGWNLSLTLLTPDLDDYRVGLRGGTFGIEGRSLSYEGVVELVVGGDVDARQENVVMAVNCESP